MRRRLKTPKKRTVDVRTWKTKSPTRGFLQLITELYKASGIPADTPIGEEHFERIAAVLEREYRESRILTDLYNRHAA